MVGHAAHLVLTHDLLDGGEAAAMQRPGDKGQGHAIHLPADRRVRVGDLRPHPFDHRVSAVPTVLCATLPR